MTVGQLQSKVMVLTSKLGSSGQTWWQERL
jgi:hypothetical protein